MRHKPGDGVKVAPFNDAAKRRSVTIAETDTPSVVAAKLTAAFGPEYIEIMLDALKRSAKAMRMKRNS